MAECRFRLLTRPSHVLLDSLRADETDMAIAAAPDQDFADLAEISYQKKLRAAEIMGHDRVRIVDPEFGATGGESELDGFQVPLYRSPQRGEVDPSSVGLDPERRRELLRQSNGNHPTEHPEGSGDEDDGN